MQVFGSSLSTWDSFECHIEDSITYAIAVFVAMDDHCFHSCWKFLVNQTQVLLNLLVLMSRKYIRHYIFWTRFEEDSKIEIEWYWFIWYSYDTIVCNKWIRFKFGSFWSVLDCDVIIHKRGSVLSGFLNTRKLVKARDWRRSAFSHFWSLFFSIGLSKGFDSSSLK